MGDQNDSARRAGTGAEPKDSRPENNANPWHAELNLLDIGAANKSKPSAKDATTPTEDFNRSAQNFYRALLLPTLTLFDGQTVQKNEGENPPRTPAKTDTSNRPAEAAVEKKEQLQLGANLSPLEELKRLAQSTMSKTEYQAFSADLDKFEKRAAEDKLTAEDKNPFYEQVARLLEASKVGNERFSSSELKTIAGDVLHSAAVTGDTNQGPHPTCSVGALASVLNKQEPKLVATLVADLAITGSYTMNDGTVMTPPVESLKPDKRTSQTAATDRSMGDHLAQIALLDLYWNRQPGGPESEGKGDKRGNIFYEEGYPKEWPGDHGSRLMDHSTKPPKPITTTVRVGDPTEPAHFGGLPTERPFDSPEMRLGYLRDIYEQLRGNKGTLSLVTQEKDSRNMSPQTEGDLKRMLEAGQSGAPGGLRLPAVVGVYAALGDFGSDPGEARKIDTRSPEQTAHAVAIYDYDPATGLCTVENQWGNAADRTGKPGSRTKMHIKELWASMDLDSARARKDRNDAAPAKAPTGDDWIRQQTTFINELKKDDRVKPGKLLEEQLTLHKYLKHWNHPDEALKLENEMIQNMKKQLSTPDRSSEQQKTDLEYCQALGNFLKKLGRTDEASALVNSAVTSLEKQSDPTKLDQATVKLWKNLIEFSEQVQSKEESEKIANRFMERLRLFQPGGKGEEEFALKVSAVYILADMGYGKQSSALFDSVVADKKRLDRDDNGDSSQGIQRKSVLLGLCDYTGNKTMDKILVNEIERSIERLKAQNDPGSEALSGAGWLLRRRYEKNKDVQKLEPLLDDRIKGAEQRLGPDKKPVGPAHYSIVPELELAADSMQGTGNSKKALEYLNRALEIAKTDQEHLDPKWTAEKIAKLHRSTGDIEAAKKIEAEYGIKFRGRFD